MADEEKNEQQEETPEEGATSGDSATSDTDQEPEAEEIPAEEAPEDEAPGDEEAPAEEAPGEGEPPEEAEAPASDADSDGSVDEAAEAEDASTEHGEDAAPDAGPDEMEGLDLKARRRLERSRRPAERRPQQSPEDRAAARGEARKQAARRRAAYRSKRRPKGQAGTGTPPAERRSAGRKTRQGRVVSSKPDKTITVQIEIARRHPQYEKIVRRSRTLHAHDARNEAGEGDLVRVVETRPLSRTKRWRLVEILEKAK
jgi:small subunit ribosomal protein S17